MALTDASDAQGASHELDTADDAPLAPFLQQAATPPPPGPSAAGHGGGRAVASIAMPMTGARAFAAGAKVAPQASNPASNPTATPALRADATARAARAQKAAPTQRSTAMERADAILGQLRVRINAGDREAIIQLNPVALGRMKLHVRVDGGSVSATIGAESAETLALLEAHAPELRSWLARDGASTVELELEMLTPSDSDERSDFERADTQDGSRRGRRDRSATGTAEMIGPAAMPLVQSLASSSADGGVDLVA